VLWRAGALPSSLNWALPDFFPTMLPSYLPTASRAFQCKLATTAIQEASQ
jgi:hypothetical protein